MLSATDGNKQNQDAIAESIVAEVLDAAVVSAQAHQNYPTTEAVDSIASPSQNTHEISNTQNEDGGLQRETKTEPEQVSESVDNMNTQTTWNRGADTMEVADILTAMRQGAFEPVRSSRIALVSSKTRERQPIRKDDKVKETPLTRNTDIDEAAKTLIAMSLSNTSEAVSAVDAVDSNVLPAQPAAVITNQNDLGSDADDVSETTIVYDTDDDEVLNTADDDEHIDDPDDEEYLDTNDDEDKQPIVEPLWLPHLRRKGGKGCREGCKACAAGIRRSEAGAGACDEDGRNITISRP
ncbi:hypothetical protein BDV97DRAFT_369263 [Delphinella strobiligena]|nr:hypothetical protein BDV97DRAFT_369263 [Delphinella strobiligena]